MERGNMELTVAMVISILSITFSIISFALNRKDKANKEASDDAYHLGKIDTKLKNIEESLTKIETKLDTYDHELEIKIEKAIENHIKEFHKGS